MLKKKEEEKGAKRGFSIYPTSFNLLIIRLMIGNNKCLVIFWDFYNIKYQLDSYFWN